MSFFSGIGDFFRGAFGEDDEEKRRRKDRERRESQQRAQKSQQSRRSVAPKTNDFFSKNSKAQPNPFGIPIDKPKTETNNPDPFKATLDAKKSLSPKEDFRDFRQKEGKNKTILGFNAAALLPKSLEKEYKYEAEGTVNIEKEKYLEGFDKLSESGGVKQAYVADLQKKAENDPLAAKTLKLLENNGRMKGGLEQFARGSNEKLAGGLTRGLARGTDQLLPGRNTFGLERFADDQEGPKEFTRAGQKGEQFGSIQKGLVDFATIAIPGSKLDKMADGTKIIKALQKGGNLSKVAGKAAAVLPGSIYGTGADYLQTKGRGDDQNLAKSAAVGTGLDVGLSLLPAGIGTLIRKARGNQALDAVDDKLLKGIPDELKDDVARKLRGVDTIEAPQVGKTYEIPKTNPTDVTKLSEKDLQHFGNQGYTAITDRYNNTRQIAPVKSDGIQRLDSLNPTGGVHADYTPQTRATTPLADNITTFDKTSGKAPNEMVTIYRGAPENQKGIVAGDYITTNKELAKSYTGDGNVLETKVPASHILDDKTSPLGEEYLYRPTKSEVAPQVGKTVDPLEALKDATPNSTVVRDIERGLDDAIPAPSNATHNLDAARERISKQIEDINNITRSHVEGIQRTPTLSVGDKTKLTEEVANKYRAVRADLDNTLAKTTSQVDEAGKAIDTAQTARQEVIGEVQQAKAATPEVGTKAAGVADVETGPSVNDLVFKDAPKFEEKGRSILQTLSPDRVVRENITNPAEQYLKGKVAKAQTSENALSRGLGRLFQGKSREAGVGSELLTAKMKRRGAADLGKLQRETIADIGKELDEASKTKVWAVLDPEQAAKLGITPGSMNPAEAAYMNKLKEVIDANTQALLSRNLITPEEAANPSYIKRAYGAFELDRELKGAYDASRSDLIKQFKGRKDVDAEGLLETGITDPSWLVAKKAAETQSAVGMVDYGNYLVDSGIAKDFPAPGLVQMPESKLHGGASGKWVPKNVSEDITGFKYTMGWLNAYDELVTHYDNWAVRRGKKALLTVFNPAVRGGNQMSNRILFSQLNGINPVQFNVAYAQVGKMMKSNDQIYREAVEHGLTGVDITAADFAKRIGDSTGSGNLAARGIDWVKSTYSRADDKAKIAAFMVHRNRGYSAEEAARLVQRGFQDYNSVGYFYDLAAKTPLIGNAFVRFASDSTRIAKNAALDHPMRTIATVAVWAKFVDQMSKMSGETLTDEQAIASLRDEGILNPTEEQIKERTTRDKETRENRFGSPKIPFTDISMTVQTPWGEVNAARFMPFYQLNNIGSPLSKTLPISGNPLQPEGWQDPLLGQFAQIAKDEDFRGKSIQDPDNVKFGDGTTKFEMDPLSADEKRKNVFRFLFNNNAPAGREVDSLFSSLGKEPIDGVIGDSGGEDIYGKKRTPAQAVLRALGVKVEQFGEEQAQEARQTEDYFKRKEEIDRDVEGLDPKTQAAFRRLTGMYKLRDEKDNPFKEGGKINVKAPVYDFSEQKYGEYMQSPELFKLMEKRARMEAEANDAPLNPIFDPRLPESFRLQLIQQKSIAPGDDIELQDRMYEDPLWGTYKAIQDEYKAKGAAYYPESNGEFTDEMVKHQDAPWAEKPPLWKAYTDAKARGEDPQWNNELAAVREKFEMDKLNWTNNERKARGLPPIPAEQWFNKTFGYSPEKTSSGYSSGYSRGYGGGGGGGSSSRQNDTNKLNNIANTTVSSPLDYIQPKDMPAIQALLRKLEAGGGGRKATPKLGAASRGTG